MKLKKLLPKSGKRGVTLVEAVMAVVVLTMFATGVLTLLTTGRTKIAETNRAANAHAAATQKMDAVIATISNGGFTADDGSLRWDDFVVESTSYPGIKSTVGFTGVTLDYCEASLYNESAEPSISNVRGWYLKLTYDGATVTGFASNTQGVFD